MPSSKPQEITTNALKGIPFSMLIGAPLQAAVEAQALAAKTSWEFIENVGLNAKKDESGNVTRTAVNVDFTYTNGGNVATLTVPLITIIPIPYIEINSVDIGFKAKISADASTFDEEKSSSGNKGGGSIRARAGGGWWGARANFNASYSSKKDSYGSSDSKYSVEYTMDVNVRAGQGDMPAGMATVLNILQGSIDGTTSSFKVIEKKTEIKALTEDVEVAIVVDNSFAATGTKFAIAIEDTNNPAKTDKGEVTTEEGGVLKFKLEKRGEDDIPNGIVQVAIHPTGKPNDKQFIAVMIVPHIG